METFKEYCKFTTDTVEQEIKNWHGGKYCELLQILSLLKLNYPLGGFAIQFSVIIPILMVSYPNRISLVNGEYELQRDEYKLIGFFSIYENRFMNCSNIQRKKQIIKDMHDGLLDYCMNIIRNTCQFGG